MKDVAGCIFMTVLIGVGILLFLTPVHAESDFHVEKVVLSKDVTDRNPEGIFSPPAYCEKDKNGQAAIPVVKSLSHLPIIADPSHGTGVRAKVTPMGSAAVAAGADGLIVEVHPDPPRAMSDGAQSLYPEQFATLMEQIKVIARAIGRDVTAPLEEVAAS